GLNGGSAADAPQQGRKPEHELALDSCSGIVVRDDGCFECLVVFNIFERGNDGLRRQSMSDCVLPRPPFAIFGFRPSAPQRIASIGLDLSERSHPRVSLLGFSQTEPPASCISTGSIWRWHVCRLCPRMPRRRSGTGLGPNAELMSTIRIASMRALGGSSPNR